MCFYNELHTAKFISHKFFQICVHVDSLYNGSTYMSVTNAMQCFFVFKCLGNEALYIEDPIPSPPPRKRPTKIPRDGVILACTYTCITIDKLL